MALFSRYRSHPVFKYLLYRAACPCLIPRRYMWEQKDYPTTFLMMHIPMVVGHRSSHLFGFERRLILIEESGVYPDEQFTGIKSKECHLAMVRTSRVDLTRCILENVIGGLRLEMIDGAA